MKLMRNRVRRGVTLTELLVVIAIISLLSTIAVPVYVTRLQQARVATARAELRNIAEALQQCAVVHGYIVPINVLDNVTNGTGSRDDFQPTVVQNARLIDIYQPIVNQVGSQPQISSSSPRVRKMVTYWQGPFLQPTRVYNPNVTTGNPGALTSNELAQDYVLDPWGRPYLLYTEEGRVGTYSPTDPDIATFPTTVMDNLITSNEPGRFDRFAVLSTGPDGLSTGLSGSGVTDDDLFYEFSANVLNETAYQVF